VPVPPGDEDDPDGPEGNIADPGEEDEDGEDDPGEEAGFEEGNRGRKPPLPKKYSFFRYKVMGAPGS